MTTKDLLFTYPDWPSGVPTFDCGNPKSPIPMPVQCTVKPLNNGNCFWRAFVATPEVISYVYPF